MLGGVRVCPCESNHSENRECCRGRRPQMAFLTASLDLTLKSGVALTSVVALGQGTLQDGLEYLADGRPAPGARARKSAQRNDFAS